MGMFDYYRPNDVLLCPKCGEELEIWQSKENDCVLLIWEQGKQNPVDQQADEDCKLSKEELQTYTLENDFEIYCFDCEQHKPIFAECTVENGVWVKTQVCG